MYLKQTLEKIQTNDFVIKVFDSQEAQNFLKQQRELFEEIKFLRPNSTRTGSKEFFVIGKKFQA